MAVSEVPAVPEATVPESAAVAHHPAATTAPAEAAAMPPTGIGGLNTECQSADSGSKRERESRDLLVHG
jgi:hypothetical protein